MGKPQQQPSATLHAAIKTATTTTTATATARRSAITGTCGYKSELALPVCTSEHAQHANAPMKEVYEEINFGNDNRRHNKMCFFAESHAFAPNHTHSQNDDAHQATTRNAYLIIGYTEVRVRTRGLFFRERVCVGVFVCR